MNYSDRVPRLNLLSTGGIHLIHLLVLYHRKAASAGGTPPILIGHGWLVAYHGVSEVAEPGSDAHHLRYSAGVMVLSKEYPRVILHRSEEPMLTPLLPQDRSGTVPNVVFPTGIDRRTISGGRTALTFITDGGQPDRHGPSQSARSPVSGRRAAKRGDCRGASTTNHSPPPSCGGGNRLFSEVEGPPAARCAAGVRREAQRGTDVPR